MHSMTHLQAIGRAPLACLAVSFSLPASSGTVRRRTEGPPGEETSPPCPAAVPGGWGAVWPLFHPTLSESLQSVVPALNLPSPGPEAALGSLLLASLPFPHISEPLLRLPNRLGVFHCLCLLTLPFPRPSACSGPLAAASWVGRALSSSPGLLGSQVPEQAPAGTWPPTRPASGSAWQPSALRPLAQGGVTLELPGPVCPAVMQTS